MTRLDDEKKNLDPGFAGKFNGQMSPDRRTGGRMDGRN